MTDGLSPVMLAALEDLVGKPDPDKHSALLRHLMEQAMSAKYARGQAEHGGNLSRKPCLELALEEIIDLPIYLLTHLAQVNLACRELRHALDAYGSYAADVGRLHVLRALNILEVGNPEGVLEPETK